MRLTLLKFARQGSVCLLLFALVSGGTMPAHAGVTSLKEIRERGVVMQKWETSCAAASLATVLTYGFGDPVSERYVAEKMLEKKDPAIVKAQGGFSLLDLKKFVEERGYRGNAYKNLSFEDLRVFRAPIVPINVKGYNHYVVFNGVRGNQVLLADPAFGSRKMSKDHFIKVWMEGMVFVTTR
jgi:predicted double-glycine peptidase